MTDIIPTLLPILTLGASGVIPTSGASTAAAAGAKTTATSSGNPVDVKYNGASLSFLNVIRLIVVISPFFMMFLLVTISIINSDLKGMVYLGGVIIVFGITALFSNLKPDILNTNSNCVLWNIAIFKYPSFISALYAFTITYLLFPMISHNVFNFPMMVIFFSIYICDIIIRIMYKCTNILAIALGTFLGITLAILFITMISASPNGNSLLYYNDFISDKIACSAPSKQKFKCSVYKNGQLLQSISPS